MKADLHVHTAASDGQYMPEEVARLAKARGLEALAVTDHDTIAGVDRAAEAGRAVGIQVGAWSSAPKRDGVFTYWDTIFPPTPRR